MRNYLVEFIWIYLVATLLGGAVAALVYRFVNQDR